MRNGNLCWGYAEQCWDGVVSIFFAMLIKGGHYLVCGFVENGKQIIII